MRDGMLVPVISPDQLVELLQATHNDVGLPANADNLGAVANLVHDRRAEVFPGKDGALRVRLIVAKHGTDR
jgi:hypothetical protein